MEKQKQVIVNQQSCQEVEGITHLVEAIKVKDAKIDSLLTKVEELFSEKNEWDDRTRIAENQLQSTAQELNAAKQELAATKVELKQGQEAKNEWENRAIEANKALKIAEEALQKANSATRWKIVFTWVGTTILTTIVGKAIENGSTQTINKISTLFPVDEILSIPYEYAATLWTALRVFVGL